VPRQRRRPARRKYSTTCTLRSSTPDYSRGIKSGKVSKYMAVLKPVASGILRGPGEFEASHVQRAKPCRCELPKTVC